MQLRAVEAYRNVSGEVGLGAADRGGAAAPQAGSDAHAGGGACVELGLKVLQVEREVEYVSVSDLQGCDALRWW